MNLFEIDADHQSSDLAFNVNKTFADKYDHNKRREELSKLQDKYGQDAGDDDEDSTDYSSEDSDAELVTPQVDAAILKIIGRIRAGDTQLYDPKGKFFQDEEQRLAQALKTVNADRKKRNAKPLKLKDYQRRALLANAAKGFESDDEANNAEGPYSSTKTPAEEERELQAETKAAFSKAFQGDGDDDDDSDDDDLLVRREGLQDGEDDEDQYRRFLMDNVGEAELENILAMRPEQGNEGDIQPIYDKEAEDDFLKNFILNRGWLDKKSNKLPTYKEIVYEDDGPAPGPSASGSNAIILDHEGSDEELERAEQFETRYNFRYEEAAGAEIQTHARDSMASMRRVDDTRKQAREAVSARKAEQKLEKMRELERLNALKKQEILDKIAYIRKVAGTDDNFDLSALDLESDYDPEKHVSKMNKVFNEAFYEDTNVDANGKPVWEDDIDITDIAPDSNYAPGGEAYDPTETGASGKKSRAERKKEKKEKKEKKRDKGKARDVEEGNGANHPDQDEEDLDGIADPEERKRRLEEYMEEYYKLNHEDIVGDLPTRFHYTANPLNNRGSIGDDNGLSAAEILMATDAELNAYESLRKIAPYRRDSDREGSKRRKKLKDLKRTLSKRRWGDAVNEGETSAAVHQSMKRKREEDSGSAPQETKSKEKRLGKKQRQKLKARSVTEEATGDGQP